jgi:diadenosine tetraphosphate (Ap4A) HIT family hydrolase
MNGCLFCRMVTGEEPLSLVYDDELTFALMDIQPVTAGHLMVVPKRHAAELADLTETESDALLRVARRAAAALRRSGLRCEGVNLFLADGEAAGQEVFHVHLHVLPRFAGDGFGLRFPPDHAVRPRDELDATAARIRETWK